MAAKYSVAARKAFGNATSLNTLLGATSKLRIYAGSEPAEADTEKTTDPPTGCTKLAELSMNATAFGAPTGTNPGDDVVFTAGSITQDSSADATGTASFFRIVDSQGTPESQIQGLCGVGTGELQLNSVDIQIGATVSVTALTVTWPG